MLANYLHGTHSYNRAPSPSPPYPTLEATEHVYTDLSLEYIQFRDRLVPKPLTRGR